eukprot:CAMPEP_0113850774 /NCGR_PEP_ID=MMETSP0372-20130328/4140_1 /TAXON_ID=340204 /ORGANISM="Lankesteria abbotti" /LENGTH=71 /DNA_ID=CAMNT_0000821247 /DNA_START=289 /DNA_END=501 /DNA_ORIENTATION=- /assembly_acc=CAM_ASM_000359
MERPSLESHSTHTAEDAVDIKEEFGNWKANTSLLYDFVIHHTLEWPTLTADWIPGVHNNVCDGVEEVDLAA